MSWAVRGQSGPEGQAGTGMVTLLHLGLAGSGLEVRAPGSKWPGSLSR
jgi:hypothetical protein